MFLVHDVTRKSIEEGGRGWERRVGRAQACETHCHIVVIRQRVLAHREQKLVESVLLQRVFERSLAELSSVLRKPRLTLRVLVKHTPIDARRSILEQCAFVPVVLLLVLVVLLLQLSQLSLFPLAQQ